MTISTSEMYISNEVQKLLKCNEKLQLLLGIKLIPRTVKGVTKLQMRFVATLPNGQTIDVYDAIFSQKTEPLQLIRILLSLSQCGCCSRHSRGLLTEQRNHCANIPKPSTTDYICDCPCRHYLRTYYRLCYWVSKAQEAHNEAEIRTI